MGRSGNDITIEKVLFFPANVSSSERFDQASAANEMVRARSQRRPSSGEDNGYVTALKNALSGAKGRLEDGTVAPADEHLAGGWLDVYEEEFTTENLLEAMESSFESFDVDVSSATPPPSDVDDTTTTTDDESVPIPTPAPAPEGASVSCDSSR